MKEFYDEMKELFHEHADEIAAFHARAVKAQKLIEELVPLCEGLVCVGHVKGPFIEGMGNGRAVVMAVNGNMCELGRTAGDHAKVAAPHTQASEGFRAMAHVLGHIQQRGGIEQNGPDGEVMILENRALRASNIRKLLQEELGKRSPYTDLLELLLLKAEDNEDDDEDAPHC